MKIWTWIFLALFSFTMSFNAEARRMGGGRSIGKQSSHVTQREATNSQAAPAGQPGAVRAPTAPSPAMPTPAPKRPWGAMLGGLAAGLGLAYLAHSMGFGEGFGNIMTFLLLGMLALMAFGWFKRRQAASASHSAGGLAYQGAGSVSDPAKLRQYSSEKIGNDASARPWESANTALGAGAAAGGASIIGSALSGNQNWGVPEGFDTAGFLTAAKRNFITLQHAWDKGDIASLRAMMTDDMLAEIKNDLAEREKESPNSISQTDVQMLEASLLGIEEQATEYLASVEFTGMIREEVGAAPTPLREVWNMSKSKTGSAGWLVAGVQALH